MIELNSTAKSNSQLSPIDSKEKWEQDKKKIFDYLEAILPPKYSLVLEESVDGENCIFLLKDHLVISLNSYQNFRSRLHTFLHESGHIIICAQRDPFKIPQRMRNWRDRTDELIDEIRAWDKGKELAKALDIEINEKYWNNQMKKCIFDYVKKAAGVPW